LGLSVFALAKTGRLNTPARSPGLEIDGSATGIKGSSQTVTSGFQSTTLSDDMKYLGTVRGRLGWTPAGNWLRYGTGGLA